MIPPGPAEEAGPKLARLLYFVGAGIVCTAAINKWNDLEKKAILRKEQQTDGQILDKASDGVQKALE